MDSPLDKIEPYQLFKSVMLSKFHFLDFALSIVLRMQMLIWLNNRNATRAAPILRFID